MKNKDRWYHHLSESKSKRASFAVIYVITLLAGVTAFLNLPTLLIKAIGPTMINVFGCFIFFGSLLALIGVLINYAWVERIGLILLITSLVMYGVMLLMLTNVTIALFLVSALVISLIERFIDIRVEGRSG